MKRKRIVLILLAALPLVLFWVIREKASWRPQMLVVPIFSDFRGCSNHYAFFTFSPSKVRMSSAGEEPPAQLLNLKNPTEIKVYPASFEVDQVCFLSDTQVAVWERRELGETTEIYGKVFDVQAMKPVRELEMITFKNEEDYNLVGGKGFKSQRGVVYTGSTAVAEWSLKTGRLLHRWKLQLPGEWDSEYMIMSYDVRGDTLVQITEKEIRIWSNGTGRLLKTKPSGFGKSSDLAYSTFSPHAELLVSEVFFARQSGWRYPAVRGFSVMRTNDAQKLYTIFGGGLEADTARFSCDGTELWIWHKPTRDFSIHSALTGKLLRRLAGPPSCYNFWFTPDDNWLYCEGEDNDFRRQRAH